MLIDIDKIIVKDRIRKDYGNLEELAEDIRKNGLINPPAISRTYQLIAGERRLKACRDILGWKQIEVHQMDVDDAEKQLELLMLLESLGRRCYEIKSLLQRAAGTMVVNSEETIEDVIHDMDSELNTGLKPCDTTK